MCINVCEAGYIETLKWHRTFTTICRLWGRVSWHFVPSPIVHFSRHFFPSLILISLSMDMNKLHIIWSSLYEKCDAIVTFEAEFRIGQTNCPKNEHPKSNRGDSIVETHYYYFSK